MFCEICGAEMNNEERCQKCGSIIGNIRLCSEQEDNTTRPKTWVKILSFLFPLIGIILFVIHKFTSKNFSKSYYKFSLFGLVFYFLVYISFIVFLYVGLSQWEF